MAKNGRESKVEAKAFTDMAIEKGFITTEQAADALESHKKVAELGLAEKVSVILVKKEYLTEEQVRAVKRGLGGAHRIAGYELMEKIGQGSMGAVFKARQLSMDRVVAVKILPPKIAANSAFIERFMREARAVAKLNHINIIQGIDVGQSGDYYYFAMEYVDGPTVREMLQEKTRISEKEALSITMQIARALDHAAKHGMVHRDVKPDNIMITSNNIAKLCDLGLVKRPEDDPHGERSGVAVGTPYYISPEQARGESDVDIRSDIYSLGATLYHMVTGVTPFDGSSAAIVMTKHLTEVVQSPQDRVPELTDGMVSIIEMMMAKERDERYQDPSELLRDIELVMDKKEPKRAKQFKGESSIMPAAKRRRRTRTTAEAEESLKKIPTGVLIAGAGAAVSIVAVILFLAFSMSSGKKRGTSPSPDTGPDTPARAPVVEAPRTPTEQPAASAGDLARAKGMFDYAIEQARKKPDDYGANIQKLRDVARQTRGTVYSMKANDEIERLRKERDSKADAAFNAVKQKADAEQAAGRFGKALAEMEKFPNGLRFSKFLSKHSQACNAIRKAYNAHWVAEMKKADGLAKQGKYDEARRVVEALKAAEMPDSETKVAQAISNLNKREEAGKKEHERRLAAMAEKLKAEARQNYLELVQKNAGLIKAGRRDQAILQTRRAKRDCKAKDFLPYFDKELGDINAVAEIEGMAAENMKGADKVSVRWKGRDISGKVSRLDGKRVWINRGRMEMPVEMQDLAAENVLKYSGCEGNSKLTVKATAYLMMRSHVKEAYVWLDKIGDGAEKERLSLKLEALSKGAEQAAIDHMVGKIRQQLRDKNYEAVFATADGLKGKFGRTRYYRKIAAEVDRMVFEANTAASGGLAAFIHGRIRKLGGQKVEILYDFSRPEQYPDWRRVRGSGSRENGGLTLWAGKEASARPYMEFASIEAIEFDAKNLDSKNQHLGWSFGHDRNPFPNEGCYAWLRPNGDSAIHSNKEKVGTNPKIATKKNVVYRMRVEISGKIVTWKINGKPVASWNAKKKNLAGMYPYVSTWSSKGVFDNFKVVGTLKRSWMESQLKRAAIFRNQDVVPGLTVEHWNNPDLRGKPNIRSVYTRIDRDFGGNVPIGGIGHDNFSIRWTGKLLIEKSGDYDFWCEVDDGGRVFLDGKLVFDHWNYKPGWHKFSVKGLKDGLRDLKVEMNEHGGGSRCRLDWQPPGQKRHRMPDAVFYSERKKHDEVTKEVEARKKK